MKSFFIITILTLTLVGFGKLTNGQEPCRILLFTIDGFHWKAPEMLNMPVFNALIKEGTYTQQSYLIIPHHPTLGDYSKFNSCSLPNPVLMEGTIFLKPENKFLQEVISPKSQSAFIVNTNAYSSVGRGFTNSIMDLTLTDDQVLKQSIEVLKTQSPRFMRIHLQTSGDNGRAVSASDPHKPYHQNIFEKTSPYAFAIENADRLLGQLISFLKQSGKWENTVLIVTSDHGQSKIGWHPMFEEDSWMTPLLWVGSGIAKGRQLNYFEHTDIAPTIAWLLGTGAPNNDGGAGKVIKEIMDSVEVKNYAPPKYIKTINHQIKEYNILKSRMIVAAETNSYYLNIIAMLENQFLFSEPFYHENRITEWYKAGSTEHLIEANENVLQIMRKALD